MKYGQFLEETLTPEWRRAYINYKALKKLIKAIKGQQSRFARTNDSSDDDGSHDGDGRAPPTDDEETDDGGGLPERGSPKQQYEDQQAIERLGGLVRSGAPTPRGSPRPPLDDDNERGSTEDSHTSSAASSLGRTTQLAPPSEEVKGYGSLERSPALSPALKGSSGRREGSSARSGRRVRLDDGTAPIGHSASSSSATPLDHERNASTRSKVSGKEAPTSSTGGVVHRLTPSSFLPPGSVPLPPSPTASATPTPGLNPTLASGVPSLRLSSSPKPPRPRESPQIKPSSSPWSLLPSPKLEPSDAGLSNSSWKRRSRKGSIASPILGDLGSTGPPRTGVLALLSDPAASSKNSTKAPAHLEEVLPSLQPAELKFVEALDVELSKVEKFYCEREDEMRRKVDNLKLQCKELAEHRRIYHETHAKDTTVLPQAAAAYLTSLKPILQAKAHKKASSPQYVASEEHDPPLSDPHDAHYNPEAYKRFKRKLRAATAEAYKGLEVLKNYRILNLTGFRKALKKFEKATKIHLMEAYNNDRISKQRFSDAYELDRLIEELEELYAARFEHGNKKTARERLRVQASTRSHHYSIFRSGILIGLALPTAIHALVLSFHADTRREIPAWGGLLQVYGAFYLPVIFALLFFLNLQVWARYRINYRFIFELDIRTVMDYREFLEIPAFLFFTLSFAFWFSFNRVGAANVAPTTWPLAWIVMTVVLFLNPLPVMHRPARYWLIRTLFRVLTPGYSRVEFAAFFLADELNSLIYSLYNIWFLGCAQSRGWPVDVFKQCNNYDSWIVVVISILPPLARLLQCLQRWRESRVGIQLVNAGKYLATIITFICFYLWRGRGASQRDDSFPAWVVFATINSVYTSAWDLLIDWSVMDPKARFLRNEKIYRGKSYAYWFAIFTNVCIRFIWLGFIDSATGRNIRLRSFIFYALEMLRRFQWNFFRVENEMVGNVDQYRVTRELPLPYDLNDRMHDDDPDSSDNEEEHREVERANSRVSRIVSNGTTASRRRAPDPSKAAVEGENPLDWRAGPY